jgi:hypothetical protein
MEYRPLGYGSCEGILSVRDLAEAGLLIPDLLVLDHLGSYTLLIAGKPSSSRHPNQTLLFAHTL